METLVCALQLCMAFISTLICKWQCLIKWNKKTTMDNVCPSFQLRLPTIMNHARTGISVRDLARTWNFGLQFQANYLIKKPSSFIYTIHKSWNATKTNKQMSIGIWTRKLKAQSSSLLTEELYHTYWDCSLKVNVTGDSSLLSELSFAPSFFCTVYRVGQKWLHLCAYLI